MELSYFGKLRQEATHEGLQQGRQEGRQEGLQQGMHLILLETLKAKFGELSQTATDRVKAIQSQERLTDLATKILTADSFAELGLDGIR